MTLIDCIKKKALPIVLGVSLAANLFGGCKEHRTEYSEPKHQEAVVGYKYFSPSRMKGAGILRNFYIRFEGPVDFEVYDSKIYERFNEKDKADVSYREVFKSTWDDTDGDGKKELLEKKLVKYEFIDAQPKP